MEKKVNASRTQTIDSHGHVTTFFGSDTWVGGVVDMSVQTEDFDSSQFSVSLKRTPDHFFIIPEVDSLKELVDIGEISVQLIEQEGAELFTLTASQLRTFAGQPLPYRIKKVYKVGTTEQFSVIW